MIEVNLVFNLRHRLVQDIEKMFRKLILKIFIIFSSLMNFGSSPLLEPFITTVGDEDAI